MQIEEVLQRPTISPSTRITIMRQDSKGQWQEVVAKNVLQYQLSSDRKFGASKLSVSFSNPNGIYSPKRTDSLVNHMTEESVGSESFPSPNSFLQYDSSNTYGVVTASTLRLEHLEQKGQWCSNVIDGGSEFLKWSSIQLDANTPMYNNIYEAGTEVFVYARFGNMSSIDSSWTEWELVASKSSTSVENRTYSVLTSTKRYLQLKVILYAYHNTISPRIDGLTLEKVISVTIQDFSPLLKWGNRIKLEEGVYDNVSKTTTWYQKFYGIISAVQPSRTGTNMTISIEAYDMMRILLANTFEKPRFSLGKYTDTAFEPRKLPVGTVPQRLTMVPVSVGDNLVDIQEDEVGFVWRVPDEHRNNPTKTNPNGDRKYINWAKHPTPEVFVNEEKQNGEYEIDYANGVIYFKYKKDIELDVVEASFFWYDMDTHLFEDAVAEILMDAYERAFGYAKKDWVLVSRTGEPTTREEEYSISAPDSLVEWEYRPNQQLTEIKISLQMSAPRATIERTTFDIRDRQTHFDAIQGMLKYVNSSYRLYADTYGNFVGRYAHQKTTPDATLILKKQIDTPMGDNNVYTKVVAFGWKKSNVNVALDAQVIYTMDDFGTDNRRYQKYDSDIPATSEIIIDGNIDSNFGWWTHEHVTDFLPRDMFIIELNSPIYLGRIDVLIGNGPQNRFVTGIGVKIQVSPDNNTWYDLLPGGADVSGSTSQWISFGLSDFDELVSKQRIQYIKLIGTSAGAYYTSFLYGDDSCWAIKEVQVWPSPEIREEVTVDDIIGDGEGFIPQQFADDLKKRLGSKTLVLQMNKALTDSEMVRARAKDYLYEVCRMLNTSRVQVIYSPHIFVGMTVALEDDYLGESDLYYVESITHSKSAITPSVTLELIQWN